VSHPSVYTQRWLLCFWVQRSGIESQALIEVRRTDYIRFKMGNGEIRRNYPDVDFRIHGINQKAELHGLFPEEGGDYGTVCSSVAP